MSDDDARQPDGDWAQPRLRFKLEWGEVGATFEEVAGIDPEALPIEYRHAGSPALATLDRPSLAGIRNVTMKKGTFVASNAFWTWYDGVKDKTVPRRSVTLELLDEDGRSLLSWTLKSAWPTRVGGAEQSADGSTVSLDRLDLSHEGMALSDA